MILKGARQQNGTSDLSPGFVYLGLFLTGLIVATGTLWAFQRGGNDFNVFYEAWRLVLSGHGNEIYRSSPDRFLYAPGFAWLLAPIGFFPRDLALALWCFGKAALLGFVIRDFGRALSPAENAKNRLLTLGFGAWAAVLLAKPILIDFQYGQVNLYILAASVWALLGHFGKGPSGNSTIAALRWFVLSIAAVGKIFPLPLLLVPWVITAGVPRKRFFAERWGAVIGCLAVLLIPIVSVGWNGSLDLVLAWKEALQAKGLPLDSHNQSFAAFLYHYFSGLPTHLITHGPGVPPVQMGVAWLSENIIALISLSWSFVTAGILFGWIFAGEKKAPTYWLAIVLGLLVLPSYLVWKPYFVFGIPLAVLVIRRFLRSWGVLVALFAGINLSGFDFVGPVWGGRLEAFSWSLWMHVALMVLVIQRRES